MRTPVVRASSSCATRLSSTWISSSSYSMIGRRSGVTGGCSSATARPIASRPVRAPRPHAIQLAAEATQRVDARGARTYPHRTRAVQRLQALLLNRLDTLTATMSAPNRARDARSPARLASGETAWPRSRTGGRQRPAQSRLSKPAQLVCHRAGDRLDAAGEVRVRALELEPHS